MDNEIAAIVKEHIISLKPVNSNSDYGLHLPSTEVISKGRYNRMRFLRFHMSNLTLGIRRHKELNAVGLLMEKRPKKGNRNNVKKKKSVHIKYSIIHRVDTI